MEGVHFRLDLLDVPRARFPRGCGQHQRSLGFRSRAARAHRHARAAGRAACRPRDRALRRTSRGRRPGVRRLHDAAHRVAPHRDGAWAFGADAGPSRRAAGRPPRPDRPARRRRGRVPRGPLRAAADLHTAEGCALARLRRRCSTSPTASGRDAGAPRAPARCRLVIDLDRVPLADGATLEDLAFGEDSELLAATPDPLDFAVIGRCEDGSGVKLPPERRAGRARRPGPLPQLTKPCAAHAPQRRRHWPARARPRRRAQKRWRLRAEHLRLRPPRRLDEDHRRDREHAVATSRSVCSVDVELREPDAIAGASSSDSRIGSTAPHGPHQGAQKSTTRARRPRAPLEGLIVDLEHLNRSRTRPGQNPPRRAASRSTGTFHIASRTIARLIFDFPCSGRRTGSAPRRRGTRAQRAVRGLDLERVAARLDRVEVDRLQHARGGST